MRRQQLERHRTEHGCEVLREGARHTIWHNPLLDVRAPVPRHREIPIGTARAICRQLSIPPPCQRRDVTEDAIGENVSVDRDDLAGLWVRDGTIYVMTALNGAAPVSFLLFFASLSANATVPTIGRAVVDALDANATCPVEPMEEVVRMAGVRTFSAFTKGARHVSVSRRADTGRIELSPYDGTTYKRGAILPTGEVIVASSDTPAEVGRATVEAISLSFPRVR